ncbi:probable tubulin polyglutamylase TTLL9 isoform X2 [Corythoichthys intestinalis]|uniref:probable tubulin polyglutamylase TTLL9 isoform X2 n=1 Tax=Corythoichthys intestinalis TaxID=161448 RepID=UPI0025A620F8|nr:probable tubulin polyglutamylase TTLL9 isoform X2 [Corythoichthys intestinalis]
MSVSKNKLSQTAKCKSPKDCTKLTEKREGRCTVRYKCGPLGTIQDVLKQRAGWIEVKDDGQWDFHWSDVGWLRENYDHLYMEEHVRINHFRNNYELTRKDFMLKNLKRFKKNLERDASCLEESKCDFFPCAFVLPNEYHLFVEEFKRNPGSTWIMKPAAKSQGAGIFLFKRIKDIADWRKHDGTRSEEQKEATQAELYVVQRYIENPYLLGGRKFDLRVYVMVTSGCKWKIEKLRRYLTAKHGGQAVETLFRKMDEIFIYSLQSVQKIIINDKHCFELYGYDIMLDENLKPWLIEVNASPSLTPSSQDDYEMKYRLLEDTLNVVDMEGRFSGKETRVGGYQLMWNDGPVFREDVDPTIFGCSCLKANTYLGCRNDGANQKVQKV